MTHNVKNVNLWDSETTRLFWNYMSSRVDLHENYFSNQLGKGLFKLLTLTGKLQFQTQILDYGCGPGFLLEYLLTQSVKCYGCDASSQAVELINNKFKDYQNWMGASVVKSLSTPFKDESFDIITCIETLEHLFDDDLSAVMNEIKRLLKPDGLVLFTTPNEESLAHQFIFCPFCQTEFHPVQHVRAFSANTLKTLLEQNGFRVIFCEGIDLGRFQAIIPHWKDWSLGIVYGIARQYFWRLMDKLHPQTFPHTFEFQSLLRAGTHLCVIAELPSSEN